MSESKITREKANPELIKKLTEFQVSTKKSWREIGDALKINNGIISQWRRSNYPANNAEINKAVERFLRIEEQKLKSIAKELSFVEIRNSQRIWSVLETAHADGVLACITGDTGTSKTLSVKEYCKKNDVIYIEANRTYRSPNEYLRNIHTHKKVGKDGRGSLNALYTDITAELKGTNTLIVIDQADYLNLAAIDVFRAISEEAGVGVVFIGLPSFLRKIRGNEPEVRQVRDRIKVKIELQSYTKSECEQILQKNWAGLNGLSDEFYNYSNGSLRILTGLVYNAKRIMANPKNQNRKFDDKLISAAAGYLEIRVA